MFLYNSLNPLHLEFVQFVKNIILTLLAKDVFLPLPPSSLAMEIFLWTLVNLILMKKKKKTFQHETAAKQQIERKLTQANIYTYLGVYQAHNA